MNNSKNFNNPKNIAIGYDPRTYLDYIKLKDVNTKHFLMISELIDNAISSFENKYESSDVWDSLLAIDIKIIFPEEYQTNRTNLFNSLDVINNSSIIVSDNAFGMKRDILIDAIKLNRPIRSFSKNNVHGRGLKQSAFFFGTDLIVKTKLENDKSYKVELKTSTQKSLNEPIFIDPKEIVQKNRKKGTDIIINNIYYDKFFSFSTLQNIKETLEYRYIRYLNENNIKISIQYNNEPIIFLNENKIELKTTVLSANENIKTQKDLETFEENAKKFLDEKIKNYSIEKIDRKTMWKSFYEISNLFQKKIKENNNTLLFEFSQRIKVLNQEITINFWMLPKKQKKLSGIRLFEGKRAICHAGYHDFETKPFRSWKKGMESGSTENMFAGSCDLSELGVSSKTDKSSFTLTENQTKEFSRQILSVWEAFNAFTMSSRKKFNKSPKVTKSTKNILEHMLGEKFSSKDFQIMTEEKFPEIFKEMKNEEKNFSSNMQIVGCFNYVTDFNSWIIKINTDRSLSPKNIFDDSASDFDNNEMVLTVFSSHPFFQKINSILNVDDFYNEALLPITLLVSTQKIEIFEITKDTNNFDSINIINKGAEKIFKNEN